MVLSSLNYRIWTLYVVGSRLGFKISQWWNYVCTSAVGWSFCTLFESPQHSATVFFQRHKCTTLLYLWLFELLFPFGFHSGRVPQPVEAYSVKYLGFQFVVVNLSSIDCSWGVCTVVLGLCAAPKMVLNTDYSPFWQKLIHPRPQSH